MTSNKNIQPGDLWLRRLASTAFVVLLASLMGRELWQQYMLSPWTRDGRIRAETVNIAAEVFGKVTDLRVVENQFVHKSDILFIVDPEEYHLASAKAEATLESRRQDMLVREELSRRRSHLSSEAISKEEQQTSESTASMAGAAYQEAKAQCDLAKLSESRLLCGQPAPSFHIDPGTLPEAMPKIPLGLPSQLLERRPDVAEAERKMAAANAQIGVAKAAFFPAISLTGDAGYSSFHTGTLLDWQSRLFQIGPGMALPILNGGRLKAGLEEARANYRAACGSYQQQVLTAFRDVSDALVDLDSYRQQSGTEGEAVASAKRAADSSHERYGQGLINYLDVLDAERTQLQTELQTTQILASRLISTVHLVKALGGGFDQHKS